MQIDIEKQLDQVKAAIIAKVPEIMQCVGCGLKRGQVGFPECVKTGNVSHDMQPTQIRLSHICLAIVRQFKDEAPIIEGSETDKKIDGLLLKLARTFDPRKDDVTLQSQETIAFLHDVLCK